MLKAAGQTIKGTEGGTIKVLEAAGVNNGQFQIRIELEVPANVQPAAMPANPAPV